MDFMNQYFFGRQPGASKYRTVRGTWKPRRKPHFTPLRGGNWQVTQSLPGSNIGQHAIGRTPQEAMAFLEAA
jgi:hypothetical protein